MPTIEAKEQTKFAISETDLELKIERKLVKNDRENQSKESRESREKRVSFTIENLK